MAGDLQPEQIERRLLEIDVTTAIEQGFVAYSQGRVVVPPVGELVFEDPPGDVHIKYGYIKDDDYFVIKVASGFYGNVKLGLPPADGLMLVFSQKTAQLECILLDECHLTNVRTAAAGAVVAKYLAPSKVERIGVFGAGVQGKMQVEALLPIVDCRDVIVWGTGEEELEAYSRGDERARADDRDDPRRRKKSPPPAISSSPRRRRTPRCCGPTRSERGPTSPRWARTPGRSNELEPAILHRADLVVADSVEQCRVRGEIFHALQAGLLRDGDAVELGSIIADPALRRTSDSQITVADLTGVAVQDIQISKAVFEVLRSGPRKE